MDRTYAQVSDIDKSIAVLIGKGVKIWSVENNLRFSAPTGVLTPSTTQWLLENKSAIIASLSSHKED